MGISDGVSVEPEDPVAVGRFAAEIAERIRAGIDAVDGDVEAVLSGWSGGRADRFVVGWRELHAGAVQVFDALLLMAERLGATGEAYRGRESANASGFESLRLDRSGES